MTRGAGPVPVGAQGPGGPSPAVQTPERTQSARPQVSQSITMAGDASSVREARQLVANAMERLPTRLRDAVVLLAHEVVTNAVVHGGGWFFLELSSTEDRVRVEVTDTSGSVPRVFRTSQAREHGRGMAIVDALASEWGVDGNGTHKTVWFELSLSP